MPPTMTLRLIAYPAALAMAASLSGFQSQPAKLAADEVRISSHAYEPRIAFRSDVKQVQLDVVVRDFKGEPVDGLTKEDFVVTDSGKRAEISSLAIERATSVKALPRNTGTNASQQQSVTGTAGGPSEKKDAATPPSQMRYIALLFDDISTSTGDLAHAKIASSRFVKEVTAAGDKVGVFTTSSGRVLDFTGESGAIFRAFDQVQAHQRVPPGGLAACPRISSYDAYRIVNNDPMAMQAAMERACHCAGDVSCDISSLSPNELLNPTSRAARNEGYGSGGTLGTMIMAVKAQAQATWEQTLQASQTTLNGLTFALDQLTSHTGKRMLLFGSSGFLSGSLEAEIDQLINDAVRTGVVINSLDAKGLYAENPAGNFGETESMTEVPTLSIVEDARSLSDRLDSVDSASAKFAESTGGLMFKNNNDLSLGFYRLGMVPAVAYLLAFPPAEDGKYHKISVKLAKKTSGELVQVRPGYQAPVGAGAKSAPADPLDKEVAGKDTPQDFGTKVDVLPGKDGEHKVTLQSHVDLDKLPFQHQKDRQVEKLTFVAALFDDKGTFITGKEAEMDLWLKPDSFARLSASGMKTAMTLEAPAGSYRLRTVIQEGIQNKMAAADQQVQIR